MRERLLAGLRTLLFRPALAGSFVVAVLALFAAGFAAGRAADRSGDSNQPAGILPVLAAAAESHDGLEDVEDSPYLFSNVDFRERPDGRLEVGFDVTRHLRLVRRRDDPLLREILVQSMLTAGPVGTRLAALGYAEGAIDPKVREALLVTLFNDPSQAVRMRALEILGRQGDDREVHAALLALLRGEDSVSMRLLALDQLAASSVPRQDLDHAVLGLDPVADRALLVRAAGIVPSGGGMRR